VLLRHAINADWPIPPHRRRAILKDVFNRFRQADSVRITLGVARVLIAADRANLRAWEAELRAAGLLERRPRRNPSPPPDPTPAN
jgi:hypothetical protein